MESNSTTNTHPAHLFDLSILSEEERIFYLKFGRLKKSNPTNKRPKHYDSGEREMQKAMIKSKSKTELTSVKEIQENEKNENHSTKTLLNQTNPIAI